VHARGFELPPVRSSDLYEDTLFTRSVDSLDYVQTGDIVGLTREDKADFRGVHMGMLIVSGTDIHVVHNPRHLGQAVVQTLDEARVYPHHSRIAWIKRPIVHNPSLSKPAHLTRLGLEELVAA
jgi:hypothetical protein